MRNNGQFAVLFSARYTVKFDKRREDFLLSGLSLLGEECETASTDCWSFSTRLKANVINKRPFAKFFLLDLDGGDHYFYVNFDILYVCVCVKHFWKLKINPKDTR